MRRSVVSLSTVALALIAIFANPAGAQRVLGVGDDALVLPRGVFRFRILGQWTWFNERYGKEKFISTTTCVIARGGRVFGQSSEMKPIHRAVPGPSNSRLGLSKKRSWNCRGVLGRGEVRPDLRE